MNKERKYHEAAITDLIGEQCADQDDYAEARESAAGDAAEFRHCEAISGCPIAEDARPNGEADASREDREEAGQKKSHRVMHGTYFMERRAGSQVDNTRSSAERARENVIKTQE